MVIFAITLAFAYYHLFYDGHFVHRYHLHWLPKSNVILMGAFCSFLYYSIGRETSTVYANQFFSNNFRRKCFFFKNLIITLFNFRHLRHFQEYFSSKCWQVTNFFYTLLKYILIKCRNIWNYVRSRIIGAYLVHWWFSYCIYF